MTVSAPAAGQDIRQLISKAAGQTGADFEYLVNTAARESSFNPNAKAPTSSAAGLFQFIEQTWLAMVKEHGAKHGLGQEAAHIQRSSNGRYSVPDAKARDDILDLRYDARISSLMAGEYTAESANFLSARIGREPTEGELYMAHFLGPGGASELIRAAESRPDARAADLFPSAARANRRLFTSNGQPASIGQLYATLNKLGGSSHHGPIPTAQPVPDAKFTGDAQWAKTEPDIPPVTPTLRGDRNDALTRLASIPTPQPGRVLSPGVIEALAELDAPDSASDKRRKG